MVDLTAIASFVGSLKSATDITKILIDMKVDEEAKTKIIELQTLLLTVQSAALTAQQDQFSLIDRTRSLEQEIMSLKSNVTELQNYELQNVGVSTNIYALKESMKGSQPAHWLCAKCYGDNHKSIFQFVHQLRDINIFECPTCKNKINTNYQTKPK